MSKRFTIVCPHCSRHLKSKLAVAEGRTLRCPKCRIIFTMQAAYARDVATPPKRKRLAAGLVLGGLGVIVCLTIGLVLYTFSHNDQPPSDDGTAAEPTKVAGEPADGEQLALGSLTGLDRPPKLRAIERRDEGESNAPWLTPERQAQVDAAIHRGVDFLKQSKAASGTWSDDYHPAGLAALPAMTLLECDVSASDPQISKALQYVRAAAPRLDTTYELALVLLLLQRRGDEADRPLIDRLALRLLAGQTPAGGWSYECPVLSDEQHRHLRIVLEALRPATHEDLFTAESSNTASGEQSRASDKRPEGLKGEARQAYDALPAALRSLAALRPPADAHQLPLADHSDNSNTQFAVLALWAAGRHGLPVERALALTAARFRFSQSLLGGWNYHYAVPNHASTPAMTCAGLLGLAVGHGLIVQHQSHPTHAAQVDDADVQRAMRALAGSVAEPCEYKDMKDRPPINLYYLWSLGRVGLLYRTRHIDGKDWYAGSDAQVLAWQEADGSWKTNVYPDAAPILNTCFALLFLQRAHWTKDLAGSLHFELFRKELPESASDGEKNQ